MGLQNTETIDRPEKQGSEVLAGPYHEAFGQLVEDAIWYDSILERIKEFNVKVKEAQITVNPEDVNNVIGHKKENLNKLKEIYDVDIKVNQNFSTKPGNFEIEVLKTYDDYLEEQRI